jgi:hypothetical protein
VKPISGDCYEGNEQFIGGGECNGRFKEYE